MIGRTTGGEAITFSETHWRYQPTGELGQDVAILTASNLGMFEDGDRTRDPMLLGPGYGERKRTLLRSLALLGAEGIPAVAMVAPFEAVPATSEAIERVCIETPHAVVTGMQDEGIITQDSVNAITNSQGSAVLSKAMHEYPQLVGDVVFMAAMSSNSQYLKEHYPDETQRIIHYFARYLITLVTQDMLDPQQPLAGLEIARRLIPDLASGHLLAGVKISIDHDLAPIVLSHIELGNRVALIVGKNDSLFRAHEVIQSFAKTCTEANISELFMPEFLMDNQRHVALRTKAGQTRLLTAAQWLLAS